MFDINSGLYVLFRLNNLNIQATHHFIKKDQTIVIL